MLDSPSTASPSGSPRAPGATSPTPLRLLLVDGGAPAGTTLHEVLRCYGNVRRQAQAALEEAGAVAPSPWDGVVLALPGPDTRMTEPIHRLRADGHWMPVLVVSSGSDPELASACQRHHALYLPAPDPTHAEFLYAHVGAFVQWVRVWQHAAPFTALARLVDDLASSYLLSPRQQEILHQSCSGFDINEIAANIGISRNSVKTHVRRILARLGYPRFELLLSDLRAAAHFGSCPARLHRVCPDSLRPSAPPPGSWATGDHGRAEGSNTWYPSRAT